MKRYIIPVLVLFVIHPCIAQVELKPQIETITPKIEIKQVNTVEQDKIKLMPKVAQEPIISAVKKEVSKIENSLLSSFVIKQNFDNTFLNLMGFFSEKNIKINSFDYLKGDIEIEFNEEKILFSIAQANDNISFVRLTSLNIGSFKNTSLLFDEIKKALL